MQVTIDASELVPIIAATIEQTLAAVKADEASLGDRIAFTEPEAARIISLKSHQLRDERLRGRIGASSIVGKSIRYTRADLLAYLARERTEPRI